MVWEPPSKLLPVHLVVSYRDWAERRDDGIDTGTRSDRRRITERPRERKRERERIVESRVKPQREQSF